MSRISFYRSSCLKLLEVVAPLPWRVVAGTPRHTPPLKDQHKKIPYYGLAVDLMKDRPSKVGAEEGRQELTTTAKRREEAAPTEREGAQRSEQAGAASTGRFVPRNDPDESLGSNPIVR